jgi:hypothetical protein
MGLLKSLFKEEKASCYGCNNKIYDGDLYGHDDEPGNLLLGGYYFCSKCIEIYNAEKINKSKVGEIYMHSDGKERYRLIIKQ